MSTEHKPTSEHVLEIREALGCAALGDYSQIDLAHVALDSLEEQFEAVEGALRGLLEMHCECECSFHEDAYRVLKEVDNGASSRA